MTRAYLLENVSFSYNGAPALIIDRLEIAKGEVVALVGPNGAGKSTLLNQLAFVERPATGTISFFGEASTSGNLIAFRRRVALLLQQPYLFHTSVLSNITWGLKIRGISRDRARTMAMDALDRVGLDGFENRRAVSLSGGETQRVALARALVLDPEVLLLDEPSNNLDKESLERTEEVISRLNRDYGRTVVFSTHNLSRWICLAHRIVSLHQGRVMPAPSDNTFLGQLQERGTLFSTGRLSFQLAHSQTCGTRVMIDPWNITVSVCQPQVACPNTFEGRIVALSEENGHIRLEIDAGERFYVRMSHGTWEDLGLHFGRNVWLTVEEKSISVLP